jgi:hypothetical protein
MIPNRLGLRQRRLDQPCPGVWMGSEWNERWSDKMRRGKKMVREK